MGGKFTVEKKDKEGNSYMQEFPFNPLSFGWRFMQACCCEVWFRKDNRVIVLIPEKNRMEIVDAHDMQVIETKSIPENGLQFLIKTDGINSNNQLRGTGSRH